MLILENENIKNICKTKNFTCCEKYEGTFVISVRDYEPTELSTIPGGGVRNIYYNQTSQEC